MKVFEYRNGTMVKVWETEEALMSCYKVSREELELAYGCKIKGLECEFIKCDMSLDMMLKMQSMLEYRVGVLPIEDEHERTQLLINHTQYLDQELHEMLREVPYFKAWKQYDWTEEEEKYHKQMAKEEAVDAFHFMLNILLMLGMSAEELVEEYVKKNTINHVRQDNNY